MVTLFLSLGLYAGNLDYNFGPLSLALFFLLLRILCLPTEKNKTPHQSTKGPLGEGQGHWQGHWQGRRLFGKIQNLYSKFNFAIFPLLILRYLRIIRILRYLGLPTEKNTEKNTKKNTEKNTEKNKEKKFFYSFFYSFCYSFFYSFCYSFCYSCPHQRGQGLGYWALYRTLEGPEATPTHILNLKKGFLNFGDKLRSQKAVLHSLVLSVHILTNLKFKNEQSAGNSLLKKLRLSELSSNFNFISPWPGTLEEKYHISDHLIKHKKPSFSPEPFEEITPFPSGGKGARANNVDFGYYLSGLIEGNGLFEDHKLEIKFQEKDISLAYYLKKEIGYGKVIKETNLKPSLSGGTGPSEGRGVKYVLTHYEGLKKVLNLLNGKLININTINQLLKHNYNTIFNIDILPPAKFDITSNYWLTGFIDAKGNFCINTPCLDSCDLFESLPTHLRKAGGPGGLEIKENFTTSKNNKEPRTLLELGQGQGLNLEFYIKYPITKGPSSPPSFRKEKGGEKGEIFFILNMIKKTFGGNIYLLSPLPEPIPIKGMGDLISSRPNDPLFKLKKKSRAFEDKRGTGPLIGEGKEQTFVYKTSNVKSIKLIIDYLDKFQLNSFKHVKFFQWRKVYRIIQRKEHSLVKNIKKIKKIEKNLRD
uniref:Uncharacterized protein n=1 Tax=Termitomyces sp. T132 TaxID=2136985 RepID=A0A2R4A3S7_9AGAR|nr:hypothetical protein C0989_000014 [Termitomyces sp. T132]